MVEKLLERHLAQHLFNLCKFRLGNLVITAINTNVESMFLVKLFYNICMNVILQVMHVKFEIISIN